MSSGGVLRRNARLRKEYLYRKSLEGKERESYEKKRKIRQALEGMLQLSGMQEQNIAGLKSTINDSSLFIKLHPTTEGKPIPTELRKEEAQLRHEVDLEDDNTAVPRSHIDDEYAHAGQRQPKVLITTSRDPSSRLVQFTKEVKLLLPGSERMNRGGQIMSELVESCRSHDFTDLIILHEHRGEPDGMVVCHLPYGPTAYFGIFNAVLRHDIGDKSQVGTVSEAAPHLIFDKFNSKLGTRVSNILKHLYPVPKPDSKRVMTFANRDDFISFRHHTYQAQKGGGKDVQLKECGPRFDMKLYQIKLGTLDQSHADNEYALPSFVRSSKKSKLEGGE